MTDYHPDGNMIPDESLCRGVKGAKICETCRRLAPGPKTSGYLLIEPARDKGTKCKSHLRMERNIE